MGCCLAFVIISSSSNYNIGLIDVVIVMLAWWFWINRKYDRKLASNEKYVCLPAVPKYTDNRNIL